MMNYDLIFVILVAGMAIFYQINFRIAANALFLMQHKGLVAAVRFYWRFQ